MLVHVSSATEMEAGRPGHHGDSVAPPVVQALRCGSGHVTTLHPDTVDVCVLDQTGSRGMEDKKSILSGPDIKSTSLH